MKKSMLVTAFALVAVLAGCSDSEAPKGGSEALYGEIKSSKLKEGSEPVQSGKNALFGSLESSKLKRRVEPAQNGQSK